MQDTERNAMTSTAILERMDSKVRSRIFWTNRKQRKIEIVATPVKSDHALGHWDPVEGAGPSKVDHVERHVGHIISHSNLGSKCLNVIFEK